MFNTRFLGKRKYAVYKQDKTPWTQEEYRTVVNLFEKHGSDQECIDDHLLRKYIADKIDENWPMCCVWSFTEQDLKNVINNLINSYIKRGFTEEEISLMTFYRYPTKGKK